MTNGPEPSYGHSVWRPERPRLRFFPLLVSWIAGLKAARPDLALTAVTETGPMLTQRLLDGTLDVAVVYQPLQSPGLLIEHLFEEELVLVTSARGDSRRRTDDYILVDWGPDFREDHAIAFPKRSGARLTLDIGPMAVDYLLTNDGSGYLHPNAKGRYAIGDRTRGLRRGSDGSLTLYVQSRAPSGRRRANWLPAPRGRFRLIMRLYEPGRRALSGDWRPPPVRRH